MDGSSAIKRTQPLNTFQAALASVFCDVLGTPAAPAPSSNESAQAEDVSTLAYDPVHNNEQQRDSADASAAASISATTAAAFAASDPYAARIEGIKQKVSYNSHADIAFAQLSCSFAAGKMLQFEPSVAHLHSVLAHLHRSSQQKQLQHRRRSSSWSRQRIRRSSESRRR